MVPKENSYGYTNLLDLVFSNNSNVTNSHPAYIDSVTDETISYGDFKKSVRQATAGFKRIGIKRSDCISICSPDNINIPSLVLGVIAAGGHMNPIIATYPQSELEKRLVVSKPKYLVAHPSTLDTALAAAKVVGIPSSNIWSIIKDPKNRAPEWKSIVINSKDEADPCILTVEESKSALAYVCFTTGTTGAPKAIMISHHNVIAGTIELDRSLKASKSFPVSPFLGVISMYRIMGLCQATHLSLYQGRATVLMEQYDLKHMCHMIQKHCITSLYVAPPILLDLINSPQIVDQFDLSSLQSIHCAAAPLSESLSEAIQQKFKIPTFQGYGMTETTATLTLQIAENFAPNSVGRMIGDIEAKVVDENGRDLPAGETGEICVKGSTVTLGYLNYPTAIDTDGYLHTGDHGYVDSLGNWYFAGRSADIIKYNAFRISPTELDEVLLNCHLVADAAVVGVYDDVWQTEVPRAYVVLEPSVSITEADAIEKIHAFFNNQVVDYKQLRGGIEFIEVVPRTLSRKVIRQYLRDMYKQRQINQLQML